MILLKNATIFDGENLGTASEDLLLKDGVVARRGTDLSAEGAEVFDLGGKLVCPGFIDLHVHFRDPGYEWRENTESGARAAAGGGYTTVVTMPNTDPAVDNPVTVEYLVARGKKAGASRVLPAGCVSKGRQGKQLAELALMAESGAVFFTDDGAPVSDAKLLKTALLYSRDLDVRIMEHPEEPSLSAKSQVNEGAVSAASGMKGCPASAEVIDIQRGIILSRETDSPIHFTHVSTELGIDAIRQAKKEGLPVTCDVTPHHLSLDETYVLVSRFSSAYKVNPPLRARKDVKALWDAVADGTVDAIVTDHAPYHLDDKDVPFQEALSGIASLECSVAVVLDTWAKTGKPVPLERLLELFTSGPAALLSRPWRSLGSLKEGAPGDVTVLDLEAIQRVDVNQWKSKARVCPWDGEMLQGWPVMALVEGRVVMNRLKDPE
ncbi:MAG: dihydroorotase [Synergistaceae bacterium]|nr:dihydroorotase [Synergistaceae bacterium]